MNIYLYGHGGSGNHGCEALVRSTVDILKKYDVNITLYSQAKIQDEKYEINLCLNNIIQYHRYFKQKTFAYFINYILRFGFRCDTYYYYYANRELLKRVDRDGIYLSIGGDNYCYGNYYKNLGYINKKISRKTKTVLWGVSIEPDIISNPIVIKDLKKYGLITARESITYNKLCEVGICENTHLIPDTAFLLPANYKKLPTGFIEGKMIGINISPLVENLGKHNNIVYSNYKELIQYIITYTDNNVVLIPHVICENGNDLLTLRKLYEEFRHTERIVLIEDDNCMVLKGYIARCRMFIGARTHATIAAYSSCIPTLALGYSVKSKGIAKDLFGEYNHYVVPVQELEKTVQLVEAFKWLSDYEIGIREHLKKIIPAYIAKIEGVNELIEQLFDRR